MREISLFMFEVYSTFLPLSLSISISIFVAVHFVCKMILLLLPTTFGMQIVCSFPKKPTSNSAPFICYWALAMEGNCLFMFYAFSAKLTSSKLEAFSLFLKYVFNLKFTNVLTFSSLCHLQVVEIGNSSGATNVVSNSLNSADQNLIKISLVFIHFFLLLKELKSKNFT